MKKLFSLILIFSALTFFTFSEQYKIFDVDYTIQGAGFKFLGATKPSALRQQFPVDRKKTFNSVEELEQYINNYHKSLESSRNFETVDITYDIKEADDNGICFVDLSISIVDSHHLVIAPYPKYKTGSGASLKLKAKDTNFLGTLNTMNTSLNFAFSDDKIEPEISFDFDYPFNIGNINATFINDYTFSYVYTDEDDKSGTKWSTKTGLSLSFPFEKLPLNLGIYQYTGGDPDYIEYGDYYYFTEQLSLGTSFKLYEFPNYTNLSYSPSISIKWNWDPDGINKANSGLSSPILSFSHSISNGKIIWNENMRKGYSASLSNSYSYNFHRQDLNPSLSFTGKFFWNYYANDQEYWNQYGIGSYIYAFYYFEVPTNKYQTRYTSSFEGDLRGVWGSDAKSYPMGIVMNLDLPHNVFTSDFEPQIINFNLQIAPFFDMALAYDNNCGRSFDFYDDGYYCAGVEFLVFPVKWSSITVRASLGVDLKGAIRDPNFLEAISNNKEIFIGIGLQY